MKSGDVRNDLLVGAKAIAEALNWKNAKGAWNTRRVYHLAGNGKFPFHKVPGLGLICRKTTLDSYFRSLDERFRRSQDTDLSNPQWAYLTGGQMSDVEIDTPLSDFSSKAVRERLSGTALKAFFNIIMRWKVCDEDARRLLGDVSGELFNRMHENPEHVLDADALTRISYLVGIFKALNILYSEPLADAWMLLPNTGPMFCGQTPLAFIRQGNLPAMQMVRQFLDACRSGM